MAVSAGSAAGRVALILVGLVLTNLTMVSVWSWRTFASSQGFADATTDMLKEPAVREAVAHQIVGALEQQETTSRFTLPVRPVVESIVADLVATEAFQGVFHAGVRELHSAIVQGRRSRLLVNVDDTAQLVRDGLAAAYPELATALPDGVLSVAVGVSQSTPIDTTMRISSLAGWLAIPFAVGAVACFAMAVRRARDRRRAFEAIGLGLIVTGVVHFALLSVGVNLASSLGDDMRERTALRAVFWSATHLINVQAKVVITIGTVLAVAAAQAGTGQIRTRLAMLRDRVGSLLAMPAWRAVACLAAIAAGFFAMRWPEATTSIVIRVVAFLAFIAGAIGLLDVLGSVDWGHDGAARFQRSGRRLAIGVTAAISVITRGDAVRRPRVREGAAGAERRPRRHGRRRLQRARRALRPAPRRGRPGRHPQLDGGELAGVLVRLATRAASAPSWRAACGRSSSTSTTAPACRTSSAPTSAARPRRSWRRPTCRRRSAP